MFGMGKKKSEAPVFLFDLEKELQEEGKAKEYAKRIEAKVFKIKEFLRKGSKKEDFEHLDILLNAYHALAVVLAKATQKQSPPKR